MLDVPGLYGHTRRNDAKAALLVGAFILLFLLLQGVFRVLPYAIALKQMTPDQIATSKSVFDPFSMPLTEMNGTFSVTAASGNKNRANVNRPPAAEQLVKQSVKPAPPAQRQAAADVSILSKLAFLASSVRLTDQWALICLSFGLVTLLFSIWWNSLYIRYATRAKPLNRREFPELYNLVENLAVSAGLPCPAIEIIDSDKRNAYASGLTPASARLGVTRGLLDTLDRDELEAVLAHELTHIRHRDSRLMAVLKACVDLVLSGLMRWLKNFRRSTVGAVVYFCVLLAVADPVGLAFISAMIALVVVATFMLKAFILHSREFVADAGAVELTKNPEALISALHKLAGQDDLPVSYATQAMMFSGGALGLFATHPPLEDRIDAIMTHAKVTGRDVVAHRERNVQRIMSSGSSAEPSFGRRGVRERAARAAGSFSLQSAGQPVWQKNSVFKHRVDAALNAPDGSSLFERWVISGRLERAKDRAEGAMQKTSRLIGKLYVALIALPLLLAILTALFR